MRRSRRVKIVVTLGPSCETRETIRSLFLAGADVFRINMSHTSSETLQKWVKKIRDIEIELGRPIGIIADLQGPKIRVGTLNTGSANLIRGGIFVFDCDPTPGDSSRVHLPHPEVFSAVEPGHRLLLDDGKIRLRCLEQGKNKNSIVALVEVPGKLLNKKGVNLPDTTLPIGALTCKDKLDIQASLEVGVDWIAVSFVQRLGDLHEVQAITKNLVGIIAKIEKPAAIVDLSEIIRAADAVLVARGDLGVEVSLASVPCLQRRIINECREFGKPVIVATQMLESMISSHRPTRAEVSDVSGAIFEGTDAIMLSAESAIGKYPIESVATMNDIAETIENDGVYRAVITAQPRASVVEMADATASAAKEIAEKLSVAAIVCCTTSGFFCLRMSRERPMPLIIGVATEMRIARRITMIWGIYPMCTDNSTSFDDVNAIAEWVIAMARKELIDVNCKQLVIVAGLPFGSPGSTNMLRLLDLAS